jgi:hypothetical protein
MKKGIIAIVCVMGLLLAVGNVQAALIDLTQSSVDYYVGSITPDVPASEGLEIQYINYLITLSPETTGTNYGQTFSRAGSIIPVADLDSVTGAFRYKEAESILDGRWTYNLNSGFYILGKYDADKAGALVWFVDDAKYGDVFTLPAKFNNKDLSHLSVYSDGSPVPVPGTLILFGSGLVGLAGIARRRLRK